jgi:hypothetical protein
MGNGLKAVQDQIAKAFEKARNGALTTSKSLGQESKPAVISTLNKRASLLFNHIPRSLPSRGKPVWVVSAPKETAGDLSLKQCKPSIRRN